MLKGLKNHIIKFKVQTSKFKPQSSKDKRVQSKRRVEQKLSDSSLYYFFKVKPY